MAKRIKPSPISENYWPRKAAIKEVIFNSKKEWSVSDKKDECACSHLNLNLSSYKDVTEITLEDLPSLDHVWDCKALCLIIQQETVLTQLSLGSVSCEDIESNSLEGVLEFLFTQKSSFPCLKKLFVCQHPIYIDVGTCLSYERIVPMGRLEDLECSCDCADLPFIISHMRKKLYLKGTFHIQAMDYKESFLTDSLSAKEALKMLKKSLKKSTCLIEIYIYDNPQERVKGIPFKELDKAAKKSEHVIVTYVPF